MQPGKSGTSATKPPPSSCGNGSMMTGYSSFGIAGFSDSVNETYQPTDVHGLRRAPEWYGQDITLCRIRHLPVGAATTGWNTPDGDGMLTAKGCDERSSSARSLCQDNSACPTSPTWAISAAWSPVNTSIIGSITIRLAFSGWEHAHMVRGDESFVAGGRPAGCALGLGQVPIVAKAQKPYCPKRLV
jgi:hypothetical protein